MSAFVFNAQGNTKLGQVAPLVFLQDHQQLSRFLTQRARANPPPSFINEGLDQVPAKVLAGPEDEGEARRLRTVMRQIEDRIFDGKHKMYHVFRKFDKDGDGFVSYKDFETHLIANKINVTESEVANLMKNVLDPDQNGYIDFKHFSKRFGVNMSNQIDVTDNELHLPNLVPTKEKLNEYGKKSSAVRSTIA